MKTLHDIPAPAKLNLFLHVTGRRADGYHRIESLLTLLDWHDTLHFELRPQGSISRALLDEEMPDAAPPHSEDDLVVRAARALQAATGCRQGAHVLLHKRLPAQAGLGGGSSDAASTLLALNRLWGLGLSRAQLQAIALPLGSDVPFFLCPTGCALVQGIGDIVTPMPADALAGQAFIVLKPAAGVPTAHIFSHPALRRNTPSMLPSMHLEGCTRPPLGHGRNDLQDVACAVQPQVARALECLRARGLEARMTGSGSAVFAALPAAAEFACPPLPAGWQARVCHALVRHPLHDWVQD